MCFARSTDARLESLSNVHRQTASFTIFLIETLRCSCMLCAGQPPTRIPDSAERPIRSWPVLCTALWAGTSIANVSRPHPVEIRQRSASAGERSVDVEAIVQLDCPVRVRPRPHDPPPPPDVRRGFCATTVAGDLATAQLAIETRGIPTATACSRLAPCAQQCLACGRCRYVSFSIKLRVAGALARPLPPFVRRPVGRRQRARR